MTKKIIEGSTDEFTIRYMLLDDVIERLSALRVEYGPTSELIIEEDYGSIQTYVTYKREETDEEYAQRIEAERSRQARQEEKERREFERLQAKFGGGE